MQLAELDDLPTAELKTRWKTYFGDDPPRFNRQFLIKRLAYRIQELAYGGLSESVRKRMKDLLDDEGYDELGLRSQPKKKKSSEIFLPGTMLVREWQDERHEVIVSEDGELRLSRRAVSFAVGGGACNHWNTLERPEIFPMSREEPMNHVHGGLRKRKEKGRNGKRASIVRCAIYTRKSTSENLDTDFNSLDAQREACELYIQSQAQEGWTILPNRYDDGVVSGATMERPAVAAPAAGGGGGIHRRDRGLSP